MCGIAGLIAKGWIDIEIMNRMLSVMDGRGPDGRGMTATGDGILGHNRLAIVDLTGGAQPIMNEDRSLFLVANGEIYNHADLRWQLRRGHAFTTRSDSEAILHLYEEEGPNCVHSLDGMFAFAIKGPDHVFLARDPLGIKPLYYGFDHDGHLCFASEIKSLLQATEDVRELPPGSWYHSQLGEHRYYRLPETEAELFKPEEAASRIRQTLERSVQKRLMADVPVGVFLSGGLDSSLISAIARKFTAGKLHSFAVGIEGSEDLQAASLMARCLGTEHHELAYRPEDVTDLLPQVIYHLESFDPALVRSAVPTFMVSQMAAEHVKVVLSGEGADELFAGYHYLRDIMLRGDLKGELRRIISSLHNTNLQRLDRMTMAHSLEGRVPFLDVEMVSLALGVSTELKLAGDDLTEKWILRLAAGYCLPAEIAWRKKEKFAVGTGTAEVLEDYAERAVDSDEFEAGREIPGGHVIRSKEEYLYWTHFRSHFGQEGIIAQMGRSRSLNPGQLYYETS